jgi:hypothetical protein
MPEEYFLQLVAPRVAPAGAPWDSGLPVEDGHTLPFVVDRGWVGPAGTYIEEWSIRSGAKVFYRHPPSYIQVRGHQSVRRFTDTVQLPLPLEPGLYDITFVVEKYRMGTFAIDADSPAELSAATTAAMAPPLVAAPPAPPPARAASPSAPAPAAATAAVPAYTGEAPEVARERVLSEELAKGSDPRVAQARAKSAEMRAKKAAAAASVAPPPPAPAPAAAPAVPAYTGEAPEVARERVLSEELAKGSDPRVAQARAKSAEMRARKAAAAASVAPPAPAPEPVSAEPAAAPPAAPAMEAATAPTAVAAAQAPPGGCGFSPEEASVVRTLIYREAIAKGMPEEVAEAQAVAAEVRARRGPWWRPDW